MSRRFWLMVVATLLIGAVVAVVWRLWTLIYPYLWLLRSCRSWTSDWGQAVLLATVVNDLFCRVLLRLAQPARKIRELKPEVDALEKRYAKDSERKNTEILKLYRRAGVTGWMTLKPLPAIVLLVWALGAYFVALWRIPELRGAPFLWIPDLSAPDPRYFLSLIYAVVGITRSLNQTRIPAASTPYLAYLLLQVVTAIATTRLPASFVLSMIATQLLNILSRAFRRLSPTISQH